VQPARGEADPAIAGLFPAEVVSLRASAAMWGAPLPAAEAAHVARAVSRRRREFAAGRHCARQALAELGVRDFALHPDADRVPVWPRGIVGSISHCEGFCGVAVTRSERFAGIGFDVECDDPLSADLLDTICTPAERRWISSLGGSAIDWPKLVFSAKECFYKCYFPLARTHLDFADVVIHVEQDANRFVAELIAPAAPPLPGGARRLAGRFAVEPPFVLTGTVLERGPA
jgi:4'-phosphopantetheinyl transferase EntD